MRQAVCALQMRYRLGLGGQANTFGCLRNKVKVSIAPPPYVQRMCDVILLPSLHHTLAALQMLSLT